MFVVRVPGPIRGLSKIWHQNTRLKSVEKSCEDYTFTARRVEGETRNNQGSSARAEIQKRIRFMWLIHVEGARRRDLRDVKGHAMSPSLERPT